MKNLTFFFLLPLFFFFNPVFSQTYIFPEPYLYHDSLRHVILNNGAENIYPVTLLPCHIYTSAAACLSDIDIFHPSVSPCGLPSISCNVHCEDTAGYAVYGLCAGKGLIFGNYVVFYASGHPLAWYTMEDGKIAGNVFHYYDVPGHPPSKTQSAEKGQLLSELEYKGEYLWNVKKLFDRQGKKLDPGNFKNGNGTLYVYRPEGNKLRSLHFVNGELNGSCTYYYSTGEKMMEGDFENGELQGVWKTYDIKGNLLQETVYENGEMTSTKKIR